MSKYLQGRGKLTGIARALIGTWIPDGSRDNPASALGCYSRRFRADHRLRHRHQPVIDLARLRQLQAPINESALQSRSAAQSGLSTKPVVPVRPRFITAEALESPRSGVKAGMIQLSQAP